MNRARGTLKVADGLINIFIYTFFIFVLVLSTYALADNYFIQNKASSSTIKDLKPTSSNPNENLKELKEINEDICAWITLEGTRIDYPVVRGETIYGR